MNNAISKLGKTTFVVVALVAPLLAQDQVQSNRVPDAKGPEVNVSAGYSFLSMAVPGASRTNINGFDASGTIDFMSHLGASLDFNYGRAGNVLGTSHSASLMSVLAGPVFYPFELRSTRFFLRGLGGVGLVNGVAPESPTDFRHGWATSPAFALGGGVEQAIGGPFAIRFSGDYLRTRFFNFAGTMVPQNNYRATVGIVFPSRSWRNQTSH
jgi:opacity protein-like surface antigen